MGKFFSSTVYILYIILCSISYVSVYGASVSNQYSIYTKYDIQELMLDMWSQLDLMQAITTTPEQQEQFAHALACQALDLYAALAIQMPQEDILTLHDYQNLCTTLRRTSNQVLSSVATPAIHTLLFVLDTLITKLEIPSNITDERSPQQVSLKDIFTP